MPLPASPCRNLCDWVSTRGGSAAAPLLACRGCGTQWQTGLGWTPRQADGTIPAQVLLVVRAVTQAEPVPQAEPVRQSGQDLSGEAGAGTAGS